MSSPERSLQVGLTETAHCHPTRPHAAGADSPPMVVARATRCLLSQLHVNLLELSAFPVFGEDGEDAQRLPAPDVTDLGKKYIAEIHICAGELDKEEGAATSSAQAAALRAERQRTEWAACITELALLVFVQRPAVLGELLARPLGGHAIPRSLPTRPACALGACPWA